MFEENQNEGAEQSADEMPVLYDADANQTFRFTVKDGGEKFETAHVYKPLGDERYLSYLKSVNISGSDTEESDDLQRAGVLLWRDLIESIENIETENGEDFRDLIDTENEILPSLNNYLAVAVVEAENAKSGTRKLSAKKESKTTTEAYFNGTPVRQTHVLAAKTDELSKKYERITKRQWKQEITKGLSRKAKIFYIPQDEAKGVLYDEMFISQTGFANKIPLRFKTAVIDAEFAPSLDPKQ